MFGARAVALHETDPLAGLEVGEGPEPLVPDGWTVVTVRAAALNHHDLWTLRGVGIDAARLPIVLGCDAAGTTSDGREVIVHAVITADPGGDETLATDRTLLSELHDGTLAERVAVPTRNLVDKPPALSFEEAACLPTAWLTAHRMLFTRGRVGPGDRVLVQGAGGGVATAAVVLAATAGAHVTVAGRDRERLARAAALGAHATIAAGERPRHRIDVVIDTVGAATLEHSLRSLAPGGRVVVSGATSGPSVPIDLRRLFFRQHEIVGSTMGTRDELEALVRFVVTAGIRPPMEEPVPLARAREAFERLAAGRVFGKQVVTIG
jgi:NADPH:quinone reductase-like Zn-dependent oxidoreductase